MLERTRGVMDEISAIHIEVSSGRAALQLRSWLPEHVSGVSSATLDGRELPSQVGATVAGQTRVLCVGPAHWLLVTDALGVPRLREHIEPQLRQQGLAVVDQTHGLAILQVHGRVSRDLLSKGCGLDLHPRIFPPGCCARTRFAQIPVIIECVGEPAKFELYVARSYLAYLQSWLVDAAAEFEEPMA